MRIPGPRSQGKVRRPGCSASHNGQGGGDYDVEVTETEEEVEDDEAGHAIDFTGDTDIVFKMTPLREIRRKFTRILCLPGRDARPICFSRRHKKNVQMFITFFGHFANCDFHANIFALPQNTQITQITLLRQNDTPPVFLLAFLIFPFLFAVCSKVELYKLFNNSQCTMFSQLSFTKHADCLKRTGLSN